MAARLTTRQATLHRESIRTSMLVNRLEDHALGSLELSPTQLRAIEILLKKTLPDLQSISHTGELNLRNASELSREELIAIAAGGSPGAVEAGGSDPEPTPVH